jgi:hypothetical protein
MCLDICADHKIFRSVRPVPPPVKSWEETRGNRPVCPIGYNDSGRLLCVPRAYIGEERVLTPRWVPSGEPTNVGTPGQWVKLQL